MSNSFSVHHQIETEQQLLSLLSSIQNGEPFADSFQFKTATLRIKFLNEVIPCGIDFEERYYFYDEERSIHIAESEEGFFWISTMGLLPTSKYSDNEYVNALAVQKVVLSKLLNPAEIVYGSEDVYRIDSFLNEQLKLFTPAIWQNFIFFLELFGKAYLSISGKEVHKTHSIAQIMNDIKKTMYSHYHNDTLFHAYVIPTFEALSDYINKIPGDFNEAYIKYDANEQDSTCFPFSQESVESIRDFIAFCDDFILDYYYSKENPLYLQPGLYDRLIQKAPNDNARNALREKYGYLTSTQEDTTHADA